MGLNVLSLFDGISCGKVALERAGISVDKYYASEIDKCAMAVSRARHKDIIQLGDVKNWRNWDIDFGSIDILLAGSPCQGFSVAGKGLNFEDPRSKLYFEFVEILKEIRGRGKEVIFLLENVKMKQEYSSIIKKDLEVEPLEINSSLVSAQNRKRLYWTNIPGIAQPEDKGLLLRDIVQPVEEKREYECYKRMKAKVEGTLAYKKAWGQVRTLDQKARALTTSQAISNSGATNVKYADDEYYILTPIECERLQTLPDNYTEGVSNTQRYKAIGNGWTVDVIAHILGFLKRKRG